MTDDRRSRLMHTLCLRWEKNRKTWVYDDAEVDVFGEPFGPAPTRCSRGSGRCTWALASNRSASCSASPFPGALEVDD